MIFSDLGDDTLKGVDTVKDDTVKGTEGTGEQPAAEHSHLIGVFVSNCKLYLSQIENCICLKLQNVFVSEYRYLLSTKGIHTAYANCKLYLSQASHIGRAAKLSDWSACFWLQVICPQQSDMYIYREQLVGPICSTFSLPFHNWKFGRFFLIFRCNLKVAPTVCYIQRKHGVESHLQFRRRVNLKILQIPGLRHA